MKLSDITAIAAFLLAVTGFLCVIGGNIPAGLMFVSAGVMCVAVACFAKRR